MRWALTHRRDPVAAELANRHYSRRRRSDRVAPPARAVVLVIPGGRGLWVASASDFDRAGDFPRAWVCNIFRNESEHRASDLIREALAATRAELGEPGPDGLITHVDPARVRPNRRPGRVFERAGFYLVRTTPGGHGRPSLLEFRLPPESFPAPAPALDLALRLDVA